MAVEYEPIFVTAGEHDRIAAHYRRAIPRLEQHFGGTPLIAVSYPRGFGGDPVYHESFANLPATITTVDARTSSGVHSFVRLNGHNVTWLCAAHFIVELDGWGPTLDDPQRAAFARVVLSPHGNVTEDQVFEGARLLRDKLASERVDAIPVLDGFRGLTLWIPFEDGPGYDRLAAWVGGVAAEAAEAHPGVFTVANLKAERGDRIYLGTKSNHPGMGTLLPYALRGTPALEVALPVGWDDLGKVRNGEVTDGSFAEYVKLFGDVFDRERARIGSQTFGDRAPRKATPQLLIAPEEPGPRNYIISAALAVLADGKAHDADDILAQGLARGLLPKSTTRKYVYTALHEYVVRTIGAGKVPAFVQIDGSAAFRINEPEDPWPEIEMPPLPAWIAEDRVTSLVARLRDTSVGSDATAFEVAACDAFAALGFLTTHVGGNGQPDGILSAPLGVAGYRVVLECKTASPGGIASNPRPEEAAKFREAAGATKAVLLAPAFGGDASLDDELKVHGVALWTVGDLCVALTQQIGPDEIRPALEAGRAEAAIRNIVWERTHGRRKRVAVIADRLARATWHMQVTLASTVAVSETPVLTEETLFVLVDQALSADDGTLGAKLTEVREAIGTLVDRGTLRRDGDGFVAITPYAPNVTTPGKTSSPVPEYVVVGSAGLKPSHPAG